jgi:hypothetical protein
MSDQVHWRGIGRWLSFAVAALLIVLSVPAFATNEASAGLNIFLGLLLFGFVASGHRRAPLMVGIVTALTALRLIVGLVVERNAVEAIADALLLILLMFAWQDVRRQAASLDTRLPNRRTDGRNGSKSDAGLAATLGGRLTLRIGHSRP